MAGLLLMGAAYLNAKKISFRTHPSDWLLRAARHNLREIDLAHYADDRFDPARVGDNQVLAGPACASAVHVLAEKRLQEEGIVKLRRDAVRFIEIVISLQEDDWGKDLQGFFLESLVWLRQQFGGEVLSAVVHHDQSAPHMHVIILPLVNGKMRGSNLFGYKGRLRALQHGFYREVAARYGAKAPREQGACSKALRRAMANDVVQSLLKDPSSLAVARVRALLTEALSRADLHTLSKELGISACTSTSSQFASIMIRQTSPSHQSRPQGRRAKRACA